MRYFQGVSACVLIALAVLLRPAVAGAQEQISMVDRGPRFMQPAPGGGAPQEVDVTQVSMLRQRVSLNREGATVATLLGEITRQTGLRFSYDAEVVAVDRLVGLRADSITVAAALTEILVDAGVDVLLKSPRQAVLLRRKEPLQNGAIAGQVSDAKTSAALVGATVVVEGTSRSASTDNNGRYRIEGVPAGTYTLRARYIGYAPGTASVTVSADQESTADLALEKSVQRLDEVVTTGTVVPTEVKALPTPVSVITESDIARQRPHTVQELFRQAVPTAVSWDFPAIPDQTSFSVRGSSSLNAGVSQMKVFVDGIEAVGPTFAPVDPNSIERIEVIRGPQAAAIYGSDAIGGIIEVFTKRGDPTLSRPTVSLQAALGAVQTPYAGYGGVLRQAYTGSVRGGSPDMSYNFGGGYSHTGDWLPDGQLSAQSSPSVYGGLHVARGIVTADVSGRYYVTNAPLAFNPGLSQTGFFFYSKPFYWLHQDQNQTVGARLGVAPTAWWQHTLTVGLDRFTYSYLPTQPRLTTPADTFLFVANGSSTKNSISYNTSVHGSLAAAVSGSLTAGFDHYSYPFTSWSTSGALTTEGTIQTDPAQPASAYRSITNNTGYFAQVQLGLRDVLFLTSGLRAEQNSDFGDSLGTPISPRAGLSYVQSLGGTTLKVRGSWGRAIRAPSAGFKSAFVSPFNVIRANPRLGPERQHGWDAGVDAVFGARGSLSVTYYDQIADNLIQKVQVEATPVLASQYQNVGRVKNTGVEIEGALNVGLLQLKGQYGYARARVEDLGLNYTGDLKLDDQVLATPKHTAGASVSFTALTGTTIVGGLTYVGSWNSYDVLAEFRCFGGTGPCQPTTRDYIVAYPGFAKINATVSQQITPVVSGFVSVDNLANKQIYESDNSGPVIGRISTIGLRFQY